MGRYSSSNGLSINCSPPSQPLQGTIISYFRDLGERQADSRYLTVPRVAKGVHKSPFLHSMVTKGSLPIPGLGRSRKTSERLSHTLWAPCASNKQRHCCICPRTCGLGRFLQRKHGACFSGQ